MTQLRRRRWMTALAVLSGVAGLGGSAAAEPRADRGNLERRLVELQRQARELAEKIRRIEAELARDARARAHPSPGVAAKAVDCTLPFYMDSAGIKHVRAECVEAAAQHPCDPPFALDWQGVRRVRPACTGAAPAGAAAPAGTTGDVSALAAAR